MNENYSPEKQSESLQFDGDYAKDAQTFTIGCKIVNSVCSESFLGSFISLTIDDTVVADTTLDATYQTTCTDDGYTA